MIQYKYETNLRNENVFYPGLFFIQSSLFEFDDDIINKFYLILDNFKKICFVEASITENFCNIYNIMKKKNIEIPKDDIFNSFFPLSLIQSIQQLLINCPKGDRILSPYIYTLSYIICLDDSFFEDSIIEMLLEIISQYTNFSTTLLHSLVCLVYFSQNERYDHIFLSQIDQLLSLAQDLPIVKNSQAIVKYSQLLFNISKKKIDQSYLKGIAQILIQFVIKPIYPNDMNGVLSVISEFISTSEDFFHIMVDADLIQHLPFILDKMYKYKNNNGVVEIIDQLINAQFYNIFLFDANIAKRLLGLFRIKIYESDDDFKIDCIDIITRLTIIIYKSNTQENVFLPLLKEALIIDKLCDEAKEASFKLKISMTLFFIHLIFTRDKDITNKMIDEDIIEFIVETEQMSGFFDQDSLTSSLQICIELCNNESQKEYLAQKLKEVQEYEPS